MSPPNKFTYPISAIRVIDGDTIEADVDLGFRIRQRQIIRLAGIDAPGLRSKDPEERQRAKEEMEIVLCAPWCREIVMHSTGLDKYGRSLAVVYYRCGETWLSLNDWMTNRGLTVEIAKKQKKQMDTGAAWCKVEA